MKIIKSSLFIFFFFLLTGWQVSAQNDRIVKRKITVNDHQNEESNNYEFKRSAIKINPTMIFVGEIPLYFEYGFTEWFVVEAGLGITLTNYLDDLINFAIEDIEIPENDIKPNLSYTIAAKFFINEDAFDDGYYVGLQHNYRKYSREFTEIRGTNGEVLQENKTFRDIGITYGYHATGIGNGFFVDWYLGLSLRFIDWDRLQQDFDFDNDETIYSIANEQNPTIGGLFGIKLGYNF